MTTPERLRRRQRREEILLILLGLAVGLVSVYFHQQDVTQRQCLTSNISRLSGALTARGDLAKREARVAKTEARATRLESRANSNFYAAVVAATDRAEFVAAYGDYRVGMVEVNTLRATDDHRRETIRRARADSPIPAFPAGRCD